MCMAYTLSCRHSMYTQGFYHVGTVCVLLCMHDDIAKTPLLIASHLQTMGVYALRQLSLIVYGYTSFQPFIYFE